MVLGIGIRDWDWRLEIWNWDLGVDIGDWDGIEDWGSGL